jgi:hypothetical protein
LGLISRVASTFPWMKEVADLGARSGAPAAMAFTFVRPVTSTGTEEDAIEELFPSW